jgi:hypothetical protein
MKRKMIFSLITHLLKNQNLLKMRMDVQLKYHLDPCGRKRCESSEYCSTHLKRYLGQKEQI